MVVVGGDSSVTSSGYWLVGWDILAIGDPDTDGVVGERERSTVVVRASRGECGGKKKNREEEEHLNTDWD